VFDSYSQIAIKGGQFVGGLTGAVEYGSFITNCYSTGAVTGLNSWSSGLGGLIGTNWGCSITNAYWDKQTSGRITSAGGTGKTTAELKQKTTFADWNFIDNWNITQYYTYPFLK
jgi:hypothetical protein